MESSSSSKGKRPLSDFDENGGEGRNADSDIDVGIMNGPENVSEEAEPRKSRLLQLESDVMSAMSFMQPLNEKSCLETEQSNKLDKDSIREFASTPILSCRRGTQLPNLEFSLKPSPHSFNFFPATPNTPHNHFKPLQQSSSHGFPSLNWGGASPAAVQGSRSSIESKQQEQKQLTIFYGGTVNVYNVSTEMAKAIMKLASNGENSRQASTATTPTSFAPSTPLCNFKPSSSQICPSPSSSTVSGIEKRPIFNLKAANLPITRKNSLQRFLEKRNQRFYARAPYAPLPQN